MDKSAIKNRLEKLGEESSEIFRLLDSPLEGYSTKKNPDTMSDNKLLEIIKHLYG